MSDCLSLKDFDPRLSSCACVALIDGLLYVDGQLFGGAEGPDKDEQVLSVTKTGLALSNGGEVSWADLFTELLPEMQNRGVEIQDSFGVPQYYGLPL